MKKLLLIVFMALAFSTAQAQSGFSTLEEKMTGKEFMAAGLDKLSEEELAALNDWLRAHSVATLGAARQPVADPRGFEGDQPDSVGDQRGFENQTIKEIGENDVVSKIRGPFKGWDGETVFELENGMIWKQTEGSTFSIAEVDNPTVIIERGVFNVWRLRVEGYNKNVKVKRIQ